MCPFKAQSFLCLSIFILVFQYPAFPALVLENQYQPRGRRVCVILRAMSADRKLLAVLTKQISSKGRDQIKVGPASLSSTLL
jgi:hypothetical protein